jgi:uncharacterized protein (TIGR02588 family)
MNARSKQSKRQESTPAMEWILGGIGAVLFLSAIAFLTVEGLRGDDRPDAISFRVEEIIPMNDAFLVRYSAQNSGTQTLADLQVRAEVFDGTTVVDEAEGTLDFLPGQSQRSGGFYLREDPKKYRLEIRAEGYQEP